MLSPVQVSMNAGYSAPQVGHWRYRSRFESARECDAGPLMRVSAASESLMLRLRPSRPPQHRRMTEAHCHGCGCFR